MAQALAVARLEARKILRTRQVFGAWALALMPIVLYGARAIAIAVYPPAADARASWGQEAATFATIFQGPILSFVLFFGCLAVFASAARGDQLDRSLHFLLLTPARRETILAGKYLAGLSASVALFGASVLVSLVLMYVPHGLSESLDHLLRGPGLGHAAAYLGITVLACAAYGALFTALALTFKNPIIPSLAVLGWEMLHPFLPTFLKKVTVIHWLGALCPVPVQQGPFALIAERPAAWAAILGLLVSSGILLALAAGRFRKLEIRYGTE